jgi:hypothetical protein
MRLTSVEAVRQPDDHRLIDADVVLHMGRELRAPLPA